LHAPGQCQGRPPRRRPRRKRPRRHCRRGRGSRACSRKPLYWPWPTTNPAMARRRRRMGGARGRLAGGRPWPSFVLEAHPSERGPISLCGYRNCRLPPPLQPPRTTKVRRAFRRRPMKRRWRPGGRQRGSPVAESSTAMTRTYATNGQSRSAQRRASISVYQAFNEALCHQLQHTSSLPRRCRFHASAASVATASAAATAGASAVPTDASWVTTSIKT